MHPDRWDAHTRRCQGFIIHPRCQGFIIHPRRCQGRGGCDMCCGLRQINARQAPTTGGRLETGAQIQNHFSVQSWYDMCVSGKRWGSVVTQAHVGRCASALQNRSTGEREGANQGLSRCTLPFDSSPSPPPPPNHIILSHETSSLTRMLPAWRFPETQPN
jgi:hypothetical protein